MLLLLAALVRVEALQEEETTSSFRAWTPQPGHKAALKSEDDDITWFKLSRGDAARPIKAEKAHRIEATQEILETEGRAPTRVLRTFTKATYRKNLWEKPFDFQGAAVLYAADPDGGPRRLSRKDAKLLTSDNERVLRAAFFDSRLDGAAQRDDERLWPKDPLKVGETAELSAEVGARVLGGYGFLESVDLKSSSMKVTFKSAETRAGARFATLAFKGIYILKKHGEWTLEDVLPATLTYDYDFCVDGTRPDARFNVVLEIKGRSAVPLPNGLTGTLELDIRRDIRFSLRSITEE